MVDALRDLTPLRSILAEFAPQGRTALLPALHAAQRLYGWLSEEVATEVGRALGVPLADVCGVIDFYTMFHRQPVARTIIRVCDAPICAVAGSDAVADALCRHLNTERGMASTDGMFIVEPAPCLGLCDRAPAVLVNEAACGDVDPVHAATLCAGNATQLTSFVGGDMRRLTAHCGTGRPVLLGDYEASGGYKGLKRALQLKPEGVIAEVKASGLAGCGGAAFPTGVKWEGAARAPGHPKYVVCNADESEPGTFKDRVLLEEDPHRIIEGMIIAAYAIGASKGYIYVRGEYPCAFRVMQEAVEAARRAGYLGENFLGSGCEFDIEIRLGGGAYICGEETALFESIEGKQGFPRVKPPFPTTQGLFGRPTAINNVETLGNVALIFQNGVEEYRKIGTEKSPGSKLFCVSGRVRRPGLYEVPFGTTLRHLLFNLAGGLRDGRALQAVLLGGAAGAFATERDLDVSMSFEGFRAAGLPLGSGAVMVFDDTVNMPDVLRRLAAFFAHESCGKCYPCQLGTQRQYEILERVAARRLLPGDADRLADLGWTMTDASLCGLGQTAAMAVLSAMKLWPEMFEESDKRPDRHD